ncbi:AAA family ATPase [Brevirhabdus pacifica]|uniref:AAA family ATPase n=1 Tax=Brevirhabdus pacifica TaxID=1267768 RepID=A0A1U7DI22_9RHOB|nr:AAA family ATPase [Brevirhabdus pacifica]APX89636.1 AAA family ATPase [Brevirhabdus pacifica]OWU74253.1 ATPase AAA [Loktanella sp. 22II-4b]PJJ85688.1 ClpA/ClpB-like protein [Brevirhabdus pacifica]
MPFLTDRIQDTQRRETQARALADENTTDVSALHRGTRGGFLKSRFAFDLDAIEEELRRSIIGQPRAIDEVMNVLRVVRADIGDPRKPLASLLFCGPTGVGKTETVRTLARILHGDADAMCRIDMNTLSQEHYAAALTGAPPGYVGSKEGTTILDQEKIEGSHSRPGIVLFDELEKASDEVILALLNVLDNGILTVASGERTYSFRNTLIFMSSNLGARELQALADRAAVGAAGMGQRMRRLMARAAMRGRDRRDAAREVVTSCLLKRFPPEFVNRIDHIEAFDWIDPEAMPRLVDVEISRLNRRLAKHGCLVEIDPEVSNFLAERGFDPRFGARGLRRAIRQHLEFPLADHLLDLSAHAEPGAEEGDRRVLQARLNDQALEFYQSRMEDNV